MGYSCTAIADDVMRQWHKHCKESSGMSNVYKYNGQEYVLEIGREQRDGAITGKVSLLERDGDRMLAYDKGTFRIDPNGSVKRWPIGLRSLIGGA
jgi:hypothetical protein